MRSSGRRHPDPRTGHRHVLPRLAAALLVAVLATVGLVAGTTGPAAAHAVLVASSPGDGERLPSAPSQVSLTFSEGVTAELGGVQVLDREGRRVDLGTVTQPNDAQLLVGLRDDVPEGTYLVSYRVLSSDGHPVSGAIVFAVGDVLDESSVAGLGAADQPVADALGTIGRSLAYGGTLLAAGLTCFLVFIHDGGPERRRLVGLTRAGVLVAAVGTTLTVVAQASLATGLGVVEALDGDVLRSVLRQGGLGWSVAVLLGGLALLYVAVGLRRGGLGQGLGFYGSLCACGSFALYGHSTEAASRLVTSLADVVHVVVAAVWFGGLVGLAITIAARRARAQSSTPTTTTTTTSATGTTATSTTTASTTAADTIATGSESPGATRPSPEPVVDGTAPDVSGNALDASASPVAVRSTVEGGDDASRGGAPTGNALDTAGVVLRFSNAAALSVFALWLSGAALAWSFTDGIDGLLDDRYGQALAVKVGLVAAVLAVAAWNRYRLVPGILSDEAHALAVDDPARPPDGEAEDSAEAARWSRLLASVRAEAAVLVLVVVVTALLVNAPPPAQGGGAAGPYNAELDVAEGVTVDLTVAPAAAGRNTFHITYLDAVTGRPVDAARELTIELSLTTAGIGPIEEVPAKAGPGHYILVSEDLTIAGTWDVTLVSRLDQFTEVRSVVQVPIA